MERWWDAAPKLAEASNENLPQKETLEQRSERLKTPDVEKERALEMGVRAAQYGPTAAKVGVGTLAVAAGGAGLLRALPLIKDAALYAGAEKVASEARSAGIPVPTWAPEAIGFARPGASLWRLGGVPLSALAKLSPKSKIGQIARILINQEEQALGRSGVQAVEARAVPTLARTAASGTSSTLPAAVPAATTTNLTARVAAPAVASAPAKPSMAKLMEFARQKSQRVGDKVWMELDEMGNPIRHLTSDQAGAVTRKGGMATWVRVTKGAS